MRLGGYRVITLQMSDRVHAVVQHAHHDCSLSLDAGMHNVPLDPKPPVARPNVVTGRRRAVSLYEPFESVIQTVHVTFGLLHAPLLRRLTPDVLQIAQRCRAELELGHEMRSFGH